MRSLALTVHAAALAGVAALLVGYAVHGSMEHNAVRLPGEDSLHMIAVLPEGWAFFTRDPRERAFLLYVRDESGGWHPAIGPQSQWRDGFGLRRGVRALSIEAGLVLGNAKEEDWTPCDHDPAECIAQGTSTPLPRVNTTSHPAFCGEVAAVQQDRVPWAWAQSSTPIVMPSRFVRLTVQC